MIARTLFLLAALSVALPSTGCRAPEAPRYGDSRLVQAQAQAQGGAARTAPGGDVARPDGGSQVGAPESASGSSIVTASSGRRSRGAAPARRGDEISIGGELVATGTPVVLWYDPGGYSAYRTRPHFSAEGPVGLRYRPGRGKPDPTADEVREVVDQLVLHYDACGISRECFRVLQDQRELSVHFLLDVDGTLYQTLDLKETAWHARQANRRSVGVEIAGVGAFAPGATEPLERWYGEDEHGLRLEIPERYGDGGVRTPDFVARPDRPGPIEGEVHGEPWLQQDFTAAQYDALAALTAALCRTLPHLRPEAPRGADGEVLQSVLPGEAWKSHRGVLGHHHLSAIKRDPGPAFQWERYLADVRALLSGQAPLTP